ncbi:MAG: class I mannose-6-phosphate isomerase [Lentisphaeria bacterium]|nr:class I mannose-6-phosphate isomerase [Lentisphaeria bacterium]
MTTPLYPLAFTSFFKTVIWGGRKLETVFHRTLPDDHSPVGEAWEICERPEFSSRVLNGPLKGRTLGSLMEEFGSGLLGSRVNGTRFPLLVKILDARDRLSLQVHPDEAACARLGGGAEPKTEMWYVIGADPGAKIVAGVAQGASPESFWPRVDSADIEKQLHVYEAQAGDTFFIRAGCVHAIGGGNLILEVQQNSDTTYRISDWGRLGADGKPRTLHVDQARECVNFAMREEPLVSRRRAADGIVPLVRCPFFQADEISFSRPLDMPSPDGLSFHLISSVSGALTLSCADEKLRIAPGSTVLIPASCGGYSLIPEGGGRTIVMKTWI